MTRVLFSALIFSSKSLSVRMVTKSEPGYVPKGCATGTGSGASGSVRKRIKSGAW